MADEGNEVQSSRMDLNLYLGLPHSPHRSELGLGSDLALGSSSRQISGYAETSASHTHYSPSHASLSTDPHPSGEDKHLKPNENLPLEYPTYSSSLPYPIVSQSTQPGAEPHVLEASFHLERIPNSPSYSPISPPIQAYEEPLRQDSHDLIGHVPYSPSYVPLLDTEQDTSEEAIVHEERNHVEDFPHSPSYIPTPLTPLGPSIEPLLIQEDNPLAPYIPLSPTQIYNDESSRSVFEITGNNQILHNPESRIQRLIESHRHFRIRRFRSMVQNRVPPEFSSSLLGSHEVSNVASSGRSNEEDNENQKKFVKAIVLEDLEEGMKEQSSRSAYFDCNICLDVAKEPVVTSCGHLFCWPCLYQWLHLHCDYKECPVCKGEVTESDVTPIYGRGNKASSEMEIEKEHEVGNSSLKIPPRPRGLRLDSLRQRIRRPVSRAFSRRLGNELDIYNANRNVSPVEPRMQEIFNENSRRMLLRFMEGHRVQHSENIENSLNSNGNGSSRNVMEMGSEGIQNSDSLLEGHLEESRNTENYFFPRFSLYRVPSERLAALAADLSGVNGRMTNSVNNSAIPQDSTTLNVQGTPEVLAASDQASVSSTMAVIHGDTGVPIEAPGGPNSVGSSHNLRRRRRNSVSGSLDVDGVHHARKRRRLN